MKKLNSFIAIFSLFLHTFYATSQTTWLPVGPSTPFGSGTYSVNNKAYALYRDTQNDLLWASGAFDVAGSEQAKGVAVWDGTAWSGRGSTTVNFNDFAWYDGVLYAGGLFTSGGSTASGLASWNGSEWIPVQEVDGSIQSLMVYKNELYVAGEFDAVAGVTSTNIVKWNGSGWSAVPVGIAGSDAIADMVIFNGDLYIAGAKELAKWDGTTHTDVHFGLSTKAYALAVYKNELYVGGSAGVSKLAGSSWTLIGGGTDKDVFDLHEFNGDLYAGGQFSYINGQNIRKIARWTGSGWFEAGQLPDVFSLAVYKSQLYAAGDFGIAKLNTIASGLAENKAGNVTVSPNPTDGNFILSLPHNSETEVTVYDLTGKTLLRVMAADKVKIDLGPYAPGIYLVKCDAKVLRVVRK